MTERERVCLRALESDPQREGNGMESEIEGREKMNEKGERSRGQKDEGKETWRTIHPHQSLIP